MSNQGPIVQMTGIHKAFVGVKALSDVDLRLFPGEVHALLGENGAGKSTLIKVLTGVYEIDAGSIELNGKPVLFGSPLEAQRDVLRDRQVRKQRRLLVDGGNAETAGTDRVIVGDRFAADFEGAGVRLVGSSDDLDERRLAGAVLADEGVHLARIQVECDVVERGDTTEALRNSDGRQYRLHGCQCRRSVSGPKRGAADMTAPRIGQ